MNFFLPSSSPTPDSQKFPSGSQSERMPPGSMEFLLRQIEEEKQIKRESVMRESFLVPKDMFRPESEKTSKIPKILIAIQADVASILQGLKKQNNKVNEMDVLILKFEQLLEESLREKKSIETQELFLEIEEKLRSSLEKGKIHPQDKKKIRTVLKKHSDDILKLREQEAFREIYIFLREISLFSHRFSHLDELSDAQKSTIYQAIEESKEFALLYRTSLLKRLEEIPIELRSEEFLEVQKKLSKSIEKIMNTKERIECLILQNQIRKLQGHIQSKISKLDFDGKKAYHEWTGRDTDLQDFQDTLKSIKNQLESYNRKTRFIQSYKQTYESFISCQDSFMTLQHHPVMKVQILVAGDFSLLIDGYRQAFQEFENIKFNKTILSQIDETHAIIGIKTLGDPNRFYTNSWENCFAHQSQPIAVLSEEFVRGVQHEKKEKIMETIKKLDHLDTILRGILMETEEKILVGKNADYLKKIAMRNIPVAIRAIKLITKIYQSIFV